MTVPKPATIDEYIAAYPVEVQTMLEEVRSVIKQAAPDAEEAISYAIPTFKLNGKNLIHFAAFKSHIGLYATPTGHEAFEKELAQYKQGKGSVQFPFGQPMPLDLIKRIAEFRMNEVLQSKK